VKPFAQLPLDAVPDAPRVPHPFARCEVHEEVLHTDSFGPIRTTWRTFGEGPPLVLIHGLMTAGYSWRYVLEPLGAHHQLVIPDLPGSGDTDKPDRSYHPDKLAQWIGEFMEATGTRGAPTIGNSLGGYLCLRLALRDTEALGPLVDLHSPGVPLPRLHALRLALSVPGSHRLLRWLVHRDPERWVHRNVHYYDETLKSREELQVWADPLRSEAGVRAFGRILHETTAPAAMRELVADLTLLRDTGRGFPVPLQLIYSDDDPMVPPQVGERLHALIPDARFDRLTRASHFAHVDAVDRFVALALDFLSEARNPA
jgi:pimeloyl-ACP methyl ester carboxylesterase